MGDKTFLQIRIGFFDRYLSRCEPQHVQPPYEFYEGQIKKPNDKGQTGLNTFLFDSLLLKPKSAWFNIEVSVATPQKRTSVKEKLKDLEIFSFDSTGNPEFVISPCRWNTDSVNFWSLEEKVH